MWLGVTVEAKTSRYWNDMLRNLPASVKFLSCEPLVEDLEEINLAGIDWVIVGGESGPQARPFQVYLFLNIRKQVVEQCELFFFKQWVTWVSDCIKRNKLSNGKLLKGKIIQEMPKI